MAFPASNGTVLPTTPSDAWTLARNTAAQIKQLCINLQAGISSGSVSSQTIVNAYTYMYALNNTLTNCAAVLGTTAGLSYVQTQTTDATISSEFTSMQTALQNTYGWIAANFPVTNGLLQCLSISNGVLVWTSFTAAQLSGLASLLTTLSATIS